MIPTTVILVKNLHPGLINKTSSMRVEGQRPELWDAMAGQMSDAIAFREIRAGSKDTARLSAPARKTGAFTIVEIIVVVAIILILATSVLSMAKSMLARSQGIKCISQLHQIGNAFALFEAERGYWVPEVFTNTSQVWFQGVTELDVYLTDNNGQNFQANMSSLCMCPTTYSSLYGFTSSDMGKKGIPYFCNLNLMAGNGVPWVRYNAIDGREPSSLVMLMDQDPTKAAHMSYGGNDQGDYAPHAGSNHFGNINVMWADNHVTTENQTNLQAGDFRFILSQPNH